MPKPPSYRKQKRKNRNDLAFVRVAGARYYLGRYGTSESRDRYRALLAELDVNGGQLAVSPAAITVNEIAARYVKHCDEYYRRKDGEPIGEKNQIALALRHVVRLFGRTPAMTFARFVWRRSDWPW